MLVVLTIARVSDRRLTSMAHTRLISSRDVQAMSRSALASPALRTTSRVVPLPVTILTS
jgi:hypothetical protein